MLIISPPCSVFSTKPTRPLGASLDWSALSAGNLSPEFQIVQLICRSEHYGKRLKGMAAETCQTNYVS